MSSIPLNLTSIHSDGGASLVVGRAVQPLTTQCTSDAGTCSLESGPPIRGCLEGIRLHGGVRFLESQHNLSKVQCRYRQEILDHPPAGIWLRPAEAEAAETNMAPEVKLRAFEAMTISYWDLNMHWLGSKRSSPPAKVIRLKDECHGFHFQTSCSEGRAWSSKVQKVSH